MFSPTPQTCCACGSATWSSGRMLHGKIFCGACYAAAEATAVPPPGQARVEGAPIHVGHVPRPQGKP
jgi:protein-arginine kinase activator protein McsA